MLSDLQNGFRKDRSCIDHIYSLYNLVNDRKLSKRDTFVCYVDMKKAFDSVHRMWQKLKVFGINGKFLSAIQSLYTGVKSTVRINHINTPWFDVNTGVKQGCLLSPFFNIYKWFIR